MADLYSFDIVSEYNEQELTNALDQARREFVTRFDFKGIPVEITHEKEEIKVTTTDEFKLQSVIEVLQQKLVKRGISLKILDLSKKVEPAQNAQVRKVIVLKKGLKQEIAKKITAHIRDHFPKAKSQIMGESVRVSSKDKDELQTIISNLRGKEEELQTALQFTNYR
ncbi:MAG: YajQ family cyclic di-GMP-binding protein [Candidatus Abawacabacteria bacterium]|nr:YajQ family cyclic di-GMP-binding protein [Candidatus Abawacabacteria bacterium]